MIVSGAGDRPVAVDELLDPRLMTRLDRFDVRTRKMFPGKLQGERRSKRRGQSVEFEDFRNYVPGDDLRFIDWNVYARLDRLFVKVFLEEEDLAVHLVVDASASMTAGRPSKVRFASRLAMALGYVGLVRNNRVAVSVFGRRGVESGGGVVRLPDMRGRRNVQRLGRFLLEEVCGVDASGHVRGEGAGRAGSFGEALTTIARLRIGKGVMVVISDFLVPGGYEAGLGALAAAGGYDTYCVQVLSAGELDPGAEGDGAIAGDLRLTDVETGRGAEVTVSGAIVKRYRERVQAYCAALGAYCTSRGMTHVLARSDAPVESLVLETLRRRGLLG